MGFEGLRILFHVKPCAVSCHLPSPTDRTVAHRYDAYLRTLSTGSVYTKDKT